MTITVVAVALVLAAIAYIFLIRPSDLPAGEGESPLHHLEERKARIYENLRDLQFEFRLGKLSDDDYQRTKLDLQRELAQTLSEIEQAQGGKA